MNKSKTIKKKEQLKDYKDKLKINTSLDDVLKVSFTKKDEKKKDGKKEDEKKGDEKKADIKEDDDKIQKIEQPEKDKENKAQEEDDDIQEVTEVEKRKDGEDKKDEEEEPKEKPYKRSSELTKFWKAVEDDPTDFTGWTYLLQYVDTNGSLAEVKGR